MASSMLSEEDVLRDLEALTDDDDSTSDPTYNQPRKEPNSDSSDDVGFLHLPEEMIVILRFLPTSELIQSVVRVCKSLNVIVNSNSILWSHFEDFPVDVLEFESKQLSRIMKHSHCFKYFEIPYSRFLFPETLVSDILSFKLLQSIHLHTLDLTSVPISSLGFLCNMPDLRILNLSECKVLASSEFLHLRCCWKLDFLYVSFTEAKSEDLCQVFPRGLLHFDAAGISFTLNQLKFLLDMGYNSDMSVVVNLAPRSSRALDQLKVADVRSLITYIPPVHHGFYSRLKSAGQTESDSDSGSIE